MGEKIYDVSHASLSFCGTPIRAPCPPKTEEKPETGTYEHAIERKHHDGKAACSFTAIVWW
jgi:hypothetical protein